MKALRSNVATRPLDAIDVCYACGIHWAFSTAVVPRESWVRTYSVILQQGRIDQFRVQTLRRLQDGVYIDVIWTAIQACLRTTCPNQPLSAVDFEKLNALPRY
jgi:hypothetical protein